MFVFVFDTETNGLPPRTARGVTLTDEELANTWPHIVQISGILIDTKEHKIANQFDLIINIPDHVPLPDECVDIHGITREICASKGVNIKDALITFIECLEHAHVIVGHNLQFDKTLIQVELHRNGYHNVFNEKPKIEYCTMKYGDKITNLTMTSKFSGKPIKKSPKLIELYDCLFGEKPSGLHNSLIDVFACARCYMKMTMKQDLFEWNDDAIKKIIIML